jgi:hypothetical protein
MKTRLLSWSLLLILAACSSGKKAYERGDYYDAVSKSIVRLRQKPDHSKSIETLKSAYPLAVEYFETQANNVIASNSEYKWKSAIQSYNQINAMYEQMRACPACMKAIKDPKNYYAEIGPLKEKAAEESYNAGINLLMKGTRSDAKAAYFRFVDAQSFTPGYKDVLEYTSKAKFEATVKIILEQIPLPRKYELSGGFFQDKVEEFLNSNYREEAFVKFYTPEGAKNQNLEQVDQIMRIQFEDFSIGNTTIREREEEVKRDSVRVGETKIDGKVYPVYNTVKARLVTYSKEVKSSGVLSMLIMDAKSNGVLSHKKFNGEYTWTNNWAKYKGDERALTQKHMTLIRRKEEQPPSKQDMFLEFTKPLFTQLTPAIKSFYAVY